MSEKEIRVKILSQYRRLVAQGAIKDIIAEKDAEIARLKNQASHKTPYDCMLEVRGDE